MKEVLKLRRVRLILLLPISIVILIIVRSNSYIAEYWFARGIYKLLSQVISAVTGLIPLSIAEIALYSLPIILIYLVFRMVRNLVRNKAARRTLTARYIVNAICTISVCFFLFVILCGTNYYRYPFSTQCKLKIETYTIEELYGLNEELALKANELRTKVTSVDENGVFKLKGDMFEVGKDAEMAMRNLSKQYPVLSGRYSSPKPILLSRYLSYTDTTGIFFGLTMEANVNVDVADYSIPATMCHELAHLRGYMRENEANYIAYLACINSDRIELQYSGVMSALSYASSQLYLQDKDLYFQIRDLFSDDVMKDKLANAEYWDTYHNEVISSISSKLNDTYLKANAQESGEKSYGEMVDLLLADYRSRTQKN
ncbi:MAG TPA: DUF3810 domain-containing protein [Lachnospiraceae bacterium]|nr:DUF3810 domain-containing protein [Lachnospiraceae bacterium]